MGYKSSSVIKAFKKPHKPRSNKNIWGDKIYNKAITIYL